MRQDEFKFEANNNNGSQTLVELHIWPPSQGTDRLVAPLNLDLRFGSEIVETKRATIEIFAKSAEISLYLSGVSVVGNSRFGDQIKSPYVIQEITESLQQLVEAEATAGYKGEFSLEEGFWGNFLVSWRKRKSRSDKIQADNLIKVSSRFYRIVPRNGNVWTVREPIKPHKLAGRYLGEVAVGDLSGKSDPLCLLTFRKKTDRLNVVVSVQPRNLGVDISSKNFIPALSNNKKVVIAELLRRSLVLNSQMPLGVQPNLPPYSIILSRSTLGVEK